MEHDTAIQAEIAGHSWAIVLAGGSGTRLSSLTHDATGNAVPKQFCSLDGAHSLIEQTLARAAAVIAPQRVTAVVTTAHRQHWEPALKELPADNVVIQPQNRGTAIGILLPALRIAARDPDARILILPSDHHVTHEAVLERAMRSALDDIRDHDTGVALLGIEANEPDCDLGYIVPRADSHPRLHKVDRFVEKPCMNEARRLVNEGALWNSFIIVCRVEKLIALLLHVCPGLVQGLRAVESHDAVGLLHLYQDLPIIDFSRDVITGQEHRVAVMAVDACGWSDLGTPSRLAKTVIARRAAVPSTTLGPEPKQSRWINLAARLAQLDPDLLHEA